MLLQWQCQNITGKLPIGDRLNGTAVGDIVYSHVFESANAAVFSSTKARLIAEYPVYYVHSELYVALSPDTALRAGLEDLRLPTIYSHVLR